LGFKTGIIGSHFSRPTITVCFIHCQHLLDSAIIMATVHLMRASFAFAVAATAQAQGAAQGYGVDVVSYASE
jgi:hypothetical protein